MDKSLLPQTMLRFYIFNLFLLCPIILLLKSFDLRSNAVNANLVVFLNDGLNESVDPCDNFYDFVCGNHSSFHGDRLRAVFKNDLLKLIEKDTKYPSVSKALFDYIADCTQFSLNNTYKLKTVQRYVNSLLTDGSPQETADIVRPVVFLEAFLRIVFSESGLLSDAGVSTQTELIASFEPDKNALTIWSDPDHEYVNDESFDGKFEHSWTVYSEAINQTENETFQGEKEKFLAFVAEFRSIAAKSNYSMIEKTSLQELKNKHLQEVISKIVPQFWGDLANMSSLEIYLDENMFDQFQQLFLNKSDESEHFIKCIAIAMVAHAIDLTPAAGLTENMEEKEFIAQDCFYDALDPAKSSAIFNLYAANLVVRNNLPMTSVREQIKVRNIAEAIRYQIRQLLMSTSWLQNDRQMLRSIDTLMNISKIVGFSEEVYDEDDYSAELTKFPGFSDDDYMIEKILHLRASNVRFSAIMGSPDPYFELNADFDGSSSKTLRIHHMFLLPPYYSSDYPDSYNYGFLGSIIGHEFFHQFAPPFSPSDWSKYISYNETLDCYKKFYNEMCFNLTQETENGEMEIRPICADGQNDLPENIADVEGARVAYQALKEKIGVEKLKERAISELKFTNEQMFFIARAQMHCDNRMKDDEFFSSSLQDETEEHGADSVRVNAIAMQMDEFRLAFLCSSEVRMVPAEQKRCYLLPSV